METQVQLLCPACNEGWSRQPDAFPAPEEAFTCTHCHEERRMSEFTRTKRDLRALKQYHGA